MGENKAVSLSPDDQTAGGQKADVHNTGVTSTGFEPLHTADLKKTKSRREYGFPFGMTAREYETARLAAEGLCNQESAERLSRSINTVKTHLKKAYRKMGVSSRSGLRKMMKKIESEEQKSPDAGDAKK